MKRVRSSVIAVSGVGLAVAVGVSACGSVQQLSAKETVSKAMSSYQQARSAKFVLSLDTTAADFDALSRAEGDDPMSASDLAALNKVLAGNVTLAVQAPAGKTFGDAGKSVQGTSFDAAAISKDPQAYANKLRQSGSTQLAVNYQGSALADLRMVNGVVYARADGPTILKLAGEPRSDLDDALAGLPPSLAPLAKAARGQWVSIDLAKDLPSLVKSVPTGDLPTATASLNPATVQQLLDSFTSAYRKNVTITQVGKGAKGTEYQLSAPIRQIATQVEPQLDALISQASSGDPDVPSAAKIKQEIAKLPNRSFDADLWVKDSKLTGLSVDLAQFDAQAAGHKVLLNVDVAQNAGNVSAPAGATPIDLKALVQDLQSQVSSAGVGFTAGATGSAAGGLDVKALKQAGFSAAEIKRLQKEEKEYSSGK